MLKKLATKQILQIMNQLNHSDMNSSCLILKRDSLKLVSKHVSQINPLFN